MHWNHPFAKTVGQVCYRVIHDQLTEFPNGHSEYGLQRTSRDGESHVKPSWAGTPYDAAEGLKKWLLRPTRTSPTLKGIPILYGTFSILAKKPDDWNDEDKALAKRRDAKEVILGGQADSSKDPRIQSTCLTCGYHYQVLAVPNIGANWIKHGHHFSDFGTSLSSAAMSLPFAGIENADFSVEIDKKGHVVSESIEVTIPANKKDELVMKIEKWIEENHFNRSLLHIETPPFPRLDEQAVEDDKARFYIDVRKDAEKETTRIGFALDRTDD